MKARLPFTKTDRIASLEMMQSVAETRAGRMLVPESELQRLVADAKAARA